MFPFSSKVDIPEWSDKVDYRSRLLLLGSCFATNIGDYLEKNKFDVVVNPFGVLYNPLSIISSLKLLVDKVTFSEKDVHQEGGVWCAYTHHSSFSSVNQEDCLYRINTAMERGAEQLRSADFLILTLGTAWVYRLRETGQVVSNCHKTPANAFDRKMLSVAEIGEALCQLMHDLRALNPALQVVFTVSPIRHWKDGAHGNQLSKAALLLAIEQVLQQNADKVFYFPAYEILMDELRDYRFYADDLCHPSALAIRYILERFRAKVISPHAYPLMEEIRRLQNAMHHRAFNADSKEYQVFLSKEFIRFERLRRLLPQADWSNEISFFGL